MKRFVSLLLAMFIGTMLLTAQNQTGESNNSARGGTEAQIPDSHKPLPNPAQTLAVTFSEGFDDITNLPGWFLQNNSNPVGSTAWFQGIDGVFSAYDGAATAYIAANYNNTTGTGTISNWLMTPQVSIKNGDVVSFWSRSIDQAFFPDRLQLRMSLNGASTDVGLTEFSVGDFSTLLLEINPGLATNVYPEVWTQYTATITGVPVPVMGRYALRYFVTNGGPAGTNSNYIGIDRFEIDEAPLAANVPLSNWAIIIGLALMLTFIVFRLRRLV